MSELRALTTPPPVDYDTWLTENSIRWGWLIRTTADGVDRWIGSRWVRQPAPELKTEADR